MSISETATHMHEKVTQKRQFLVILMIVFLGFIGISMPYLIFPALFFHPAYAIMQGDDVSRALFLGVTLAAYPLGQFLGSPILGSLSDDYGRRPLLASSLVVAALSNLLSGFAIAWQHLGLLILSRFLAGLMEGNIAIARAMAADLKLLSKHKTFGMVNAAASIAYLVGPLLGGLMSDPAIFETLTISTPFYIIFVLFIALAGLSMCVLKQALPLAPKETRGFWQRINLMHRLSVLFKNQQLKVLMMISTCFTLAVDIFYEFGPVYLTLEWALGPSELVWYNAVLCLGLILGNGWLPSVVSKHVLNHRLVILASMVAFTVLLLGLVLTQTAPLMLILFGVSGLFIGLAVTLITVQISNSASDAIQGEVMGVQLSLRVLGDGIICLFGAALLLLSSKLILILAALMSLGIVLYSIKKCPAF